MTFSVRVFILLCVIQLIKNSLAEKSATCVNRKCIHKCCQKNEVVVKFRDCGPDNQHEVRDLASVPVYNENRQGIGFFNDYFDTKPLSKGVFRSEMLPSSLKYKPQFYLLQNGTILFTPFLDKENKTFVALNGEDFCFDYRLFSNKTAHLQVKVWYKNKKPEQPVLQRNPSLKIGLLIISSIFLIMVLVVYSLLEELRNLPGLIVMAYVSSLLLGFIFFIVLTSKEHSPHSCIAITLLICYFMIATFCWMTVMSYDAWWTFRGFAKALKINRRGETFKFKMYCLFAYGTPSVFAVLIGVLNSVDRKNLPDSFIKPNIPSRGCFLEGEAVLAYVYGPMLILIIMNWLFFIMTTYNIWKRCADAKVLYTGDSAASGSNSAIRTNKQRFLLYLKLSVLMGLSWILEVVSSFKFASTFWYITDVYNVLLGVVIFIIYVCKKKVLIKLRDRFRRKKKNKVQTAINLRVQPERNKAHHFNFNTPVRLVGGSDVPIV